MCKFFAVKMDIALQAKIKGYLTTVRQEHLRHNHIAALAAFRAAAKLDPQDCLL